MNHISIINQAGPVIVDFISTPLIWVAIPGLAGLIFWFMRRRAGWVIFLSTVLCLILAGLAWLLPIGQAMHVGPFSLTIDSTLGFAGRRLVLDTVDRTFLIFIFLICAFWFAGSYSAGANQLLIPFGLGMAALLVAARAVQPFLYAALLVEMAVLLAVPILAPPGKVFGQGVLRYIIFQTLAMPFILLAGWALAGVDANPNNQTLITLSIIFLGLGFAFWLAVFPFYSWIPLLAEQSFPYVSGFIFILLPTINFLLGLSYLNNFGWLRESPNLYTLLRQVGALMVVTAGLWAAFQKDLARLLGYAVIVETGFSLLAVSLGSKIGDMLFVSMFLPRLIGLGLWALSLSVLMRETRSTRFEDVHGLAQRMPFASAGLAVASLTLAGLPLLAAFPIRQVLLEELSRRSLIDALWALAGMVGMLFSTFRALAVLARGAVVTAPPMAELPQLFPEAPANQPALPAVERIAFPQTFCETRMQIVLLVGGIVSLLLIGLFPQAFTSMLSGLMAAFPQLP